MTRIAFTVPGPPIAKHRPRFSRAGGVFAHPADRFYEKLVQESAREAGAVVLEGPLKVRITAWRKAAKWPKAGPLIAYDVKRPDVDNLAKTICDALNGVAWKDDAAVVHLTVRKFVTGCMEGVDVEIETLNPREGESDG